MKVSIPEGYSFAQIAALMEEKKVCKKADLMATVNTYDFSYYPLVGKITNTSSKAFKLEGYLHSNTYEFYTNEKPENVLGKLLRNNEAFITESMRARASEIGMTMDEVLTLASIIEKETGRTSQMKTVSSVFHNRLKQGMRLQSDVTIFYVERYVKPNISGDINRYNSLYNTYKCAALPAGPICSPGDDAINAALYPEDTGYLYFVADANIV